MSYREKLVKRRSKGKLISMSRIFLKILVRPECGLA
jgi:hypothetical protein